MILVGYIGICFTCANTFGHILYMCHDKCISSNIHISMKPSCHGRDRMVVGFTNT